MKIYFLGTCAGTEPMPDRKHASMAVECDGAIYWFDAGEGCSYTAHNLGMDLLRVKTIVISHPHMDHVGGLGNLLWNIRKLSGVKKQDPYYGKVQVYMPKMETWEGIMMILRHSEGHFFTSYPVCATEVQEGVLFDDGTIRVTAYGNTHMKGEENGRCSSYSYAIEGDGKKLVYSGDVGSYQELDRAIGDGCDGLILETGHFGIDTARDYVKGKQIGKLFFSHNGREILNHPEASQQKVDDYFQGRGVICKDGMVVEL